MKRQAGFTLVEIAIVLVIIGLLLGGVLKGQELIESAKVKNIAQDMRSISVAVLTYQDKYRALPGDDRGAVARWGAGTCDPATKTTQGNGLIDSGSFADNAAGAGGTKSEPSCVWDHLRRANLLTGDPGAGNPTHADAGVFSVVSASTSAAITDTPGTLIVCGTNIRGRHVVPLDAMLDDGVVHTGAMRAIKSTTAGPSAAQSGAIDEGAGFLVCMGF
ncbi:prepilin-type N-terminal cleavage/methylation domain-containing protein [Niveibacterium sp. 24ML]|uniref:prepilin-type N-terminal cleavage/methylation domain-containing protein n=1 Tax=Niveibacterium sp. 24ML TaxID=2985512 RepID=UPI002271404F|nr:prepilin-type N-terminal cleavage/methylation domain-containing protein [Niveibacterium sp. 24ML]MCX9154833.1 prepilin-type N-terminal cleavage/methylation domain-containing protein [Niveibacterium sp. 24ML]